MFKCPITLENTALIGPLICCNADRLVVLLCRAHGVVLVILEVNVLIAYLPGRLSIVFSLLSSRNCALSFYLLFYLGVIINNSVDSQACHMKISFLHSSLLSQIAACPFSEPSS